MRDILPHQFIFLDEMHVTRKDLDRPYGWAIKGERAYGVGYTIGKSRFNITAAFSLRGFIAWDIAFVDSSSANDNSNDNGMNTQVKFVRFMSDVLIEQGLLQDFPNPESVLVLDNASVHDVPQVRETIQRIGCGFFNTP